MRFWDSPYSYRVVDIVVNVEPTMFSFAYYLIDPIDPDYRFNAPEHLLMPIVDEIKLADGVDKLVTI